MTETNDYTNAPMDYDPILLNAEEIKSTPVPWLWEGRIPRGRLTLLVGRPAVGKSFLTMDWAARVSTGADWPDGTACPSGEVLLLCDEDDLSHTIKPRLEAHNAATNRIEIFKGVRRLDGNKPYDEAFTLENLEPLWRAVQQKKNLKLIVIDPIGSYIGGGTDANADNKVRAILGPLNTIAADSGAAVVMVAHQRKATSSYADDMALGSRAFTGISRSVLHAMVRLNDPKTKLLLPGKMNLGPPPLGLSFTIDGTPPKLQWNPDPVRESADDILAMNNRANPTNKNDEAKKFLIDILANGPVEANEVTRKSEIADIAFRTLERAKKELCVKSNRDKYGPGGKVFWRLPETTGE